MYLASGVLGATGGARPTGIDEIDLIFLAAGGAAAAACAGRARTTAIYAAAGAAALCQPAGWPLVLAGIALMATLARRFWSRRSLLGAVAGGLTWAATVGAPFEPGAVPIFVPVVALAWVVWSARCSGSRSFRQRLDRVAGVGVGVATAGILLGALAVVTARVHVDRGVDLVDSGLESARLGDTDAAVADLRSAQRALARGESSLGALWARPAWLVPGVSQNIRVLDAVVGEVRTLAGAGIATAEEADLGSLRARRGEIDLAAVAAVEDPLIDVLGRLEASAERITDLGGGWLAFPVANRLEDLRVEIDDAAESVELAIEGVRIAPSLLGGDGPRTYLVLFTTPVEARATTGFPGNFAEVVFDDGRFDMVRFGRIGELVAALPEGGGTLRGPPDYLARYGRFSPHWEWRNITMSPDFPTVAAVAAELYPQSGGVPVDGVMSVDPVALAALLRFTGPIAVPGVREPLTFENAAEFLLRDQYVELPDTPERIDALETLAEMAFDRLTSVELPGPRQLGDVLGPVVADGHLQVATFGTKEAAFLDELGISGRYPVVDGDFVGVTTSNAGAGKIDLFARRALDYVVRWDRSTGALAATATVTLANDAPSSRLPSYVIGNLLGRRPLEEPLPPGWSNTFVTLYTPWDHVRATLDGEPLAVERIDELGRRALSAFVAIPPGGTRTLVVELEGVLTQPTYRLDLAAQPLVVPETASVAVVVAGSGGGRLRASGPVEVTEGRVQGEFSLVRDTTVTIRDR